MGKHLLEGCGAALILTLTYTWGQVSPYHMALFHAVLPVTSVTAAVLIDLLAVSALCAGCAAALSEKRAARFPAWAFVLAGLTGALVYGIGKLTERPLPWLRPGMGALFSAVALLALWRFRPRAYLRVVSGARLLLALLGCSMFWVVPQLVYGALHHQQADLVSYRSLGPMPQPARKGRIIWVLFDELSQDQLFDHRAPGLALPNFDRLRRESVSYTAVRPEAFYTERVTTSLLLGRPVTDVRSNWSGDALLKMADTERWERFDAQRSIFAEARRGGWSTGLAGWFNPYCRMLPGVLDACTWKYITVWPGHMSQRNSAMRNAAMPLLNTLRRARHQPSADPTFKAAHLDEATALVGSATELIGDERLRFVFIHLPIPHPPGVYDRETGGVRADGSYLDNLAYSDGVLGRLREAIAQTRSAGETTLIVCSDHAFRVPLWRGGSFWTAEDERATADHFDPRPVLLVHFPGQGEGAQVAEPQDGLIVHRILQALLRGTLADAAALRASTAAAGTK